MTGHRPRTPASAAVLLLTFAACTATTAQDAFRGAGDPARVRAALSKLKDPGRRPANAAGRAMVFLVTSGVGSVRSEILACDIEAGSVLWRQSADVTGRVATGSKSLIVAERDEGKQPILTARDLRDGKVLWRQALDAGQRRVGYAADGDDAYEVIEEASATGPNRQVTLVAYDASSGSVRWQSNLVGEAGAPAARGGLLALPRRSQFVTLIDGATGDVMADILSRDLAASFVQMLPEGLFFGSRGVFLASSATAMGSRQATGYMQAKLPPFVRPLYHRDMYRAFEGDYSAVDRNRVLWRVNVGGATPTFSGGAVVVHHFRFFFSFDAATGALRWAYREPRADIVAAEHLGARIVFVTSDAEVGSVDAATGGLIFRTSIKALAGQPWSLRGATFDAEGFSGVGGSTTKARALADVLAEVAWENDTRFSEAKVFAVSELAKLPGKQVTRDLLRALSGNGGDLPTVVLARVVEALMKRKDPDSIELYIEALKSHPDTVEDRRPGRLDVLANAVGALGVRQAVPALVEYLRLPETDPDMVRSVADAVLALQSADAVDPFSDYLVQYRADPAFAARPAPLIAACDVLLKLGGPASRTLMLFLAEDARTVEPVRAYLQRAMGQAGDPARQGSQ